MIKDEHYEAAGTNGFREIPFEEAITRVEAPLVAMGETLETAYDSAYSGEKMRHCAKLALRCCGFELRRKTGQYKLRTRAAAP